MSLVGAVYKWRLDNNTYVDIIDGQVRGLFRLRGV